jgi:hypothetical protein
VSEVHVFDASALIALFRGRERAYELYVDADTGLDPMVWPACAIGEANTYLKAGSGTWEALLLGRITIADLTANGGIEAGLLASHLATGQVIHEASMTRGTVVTDDPDRYRPWTVPLMVL